MGWLYDKKNRIKEHFDGETCVEAFVDWCLRQMDFAYGSKNRKNKPGKIVMWSFNGSRFDNIFLFPHLLKVSNVEVYGTATNLKMMQIGNLWF